MENENKLKEAASIMGRKGGKSKSRRKVVAARSNGRKGGRPKRKGVNDGTNKGRID